tara:strand:- start:1325 stop:2047 length:723 start_codon:yes stop_codon:yes gene_type:complete
MNKINIILLFVAMNLISCGIFKKSNLENSLLNDRVLLEKELIKKTNSHNVSPEWTSISSKIKITKEGQETTINAQIRIKKDSVIWISVKAPLGIEIFRTMITPDTIYYINRINKGYFKKHISHTQELLKTNVSFNQIQEILFSSPNIKALNSEKEKYEINKEIFRVVNMELKQRDGKKISVNYDGYKAFSRLGGLYFAKKVYIDIKSEEVFNAEISYTKIDFNKKSSLSFKIPKSYARIN